MTGRLTLRWAGYPTIRTGSPTLATTPGPTLGPTLGVTPEVTPEVRSPTQRRERRPSRESMPRSVSQVRARRPKAMEMLSSFMRIHLDTSRLRFDGLARVFPSPPVDGRCHRAAHFGAVQFIRRTHRSFRDRCHGEGRFRPEHSVFRPFRGRQDRQRLSRKSTETLRSSSWSLRTSGRSSTRRSASSRPIAREE